MRSDVHTDGEGGDWIRGMGLANPVGTGEAQDRRPRLGCGRWGVGRGLGLGYGGVELRHAHVRCESGISDKSRYLYIVPGGHLRILGAPSVQSCCTLWISAS